MLTNGGIVDMTGLAAVSTRSRIPAGVIERLLEFGLSYFKCLGPRGVVGFSGADGAKLSVTIAVWVVGRFSVATSQ